MNFWMKFFSRENLFTQNLNSFQVTMYANLKILAIYDELKSKMICPILFKNSISIQTEGKMLKTMSYRQR